jgi:hypothetical protein
VTAALRRCAKPIFGKAFIKFIADSLPPVNLLAWNREPRGIHRDHWT